MPDPEPVKRDHPVLKFLGRTDVAHYLGLRSLRSLSGVELPPHDAEIGPKKGWLPATIDVWQATRPGRGRWGARTGNRRDGTMITRNDKEQK